MKKTNDTENNSQTKKGISPVVKWFWYIFAGGIVAIMLLFLSASLGLLGEMPDFKH